MPAGIFEIAQDPYGSQVRYSHTSPLNFTIQPWQRRIIVHHVLEEAKEDAEAADQRSASAVRVEQPPVGAESCRGQREKRATVETALVSHDAGRTSLMKARTGMGHQCRH